jgi:photosystem II stability/assembly factor-like uncharacterized protein
MQVYIKATGDKSAEMVTDEGAIYVTSNRGYNWRAAVQETVSATLNRSLSATLKNLDPINYISTSDLLTDN